MHTASLLRALVVCTAALLLCAVTVGAQSQNCQNGFVLSLYQCLSNRSIDRENFLWLTRNGTLGREPADLQSFTSRVCIEKSGLTMCVKTALDNSLALPDAQCNQAQKGSLSALYKGIFKNLDSKCRDPCRKTLASDLTKCYTHKMFTGSDYLLFNVTNERDAVLGTNATEVDRFCQERASLMDCLKTTALNCNDAPFMLRSFGLDFQALNDTYNVLCNYTTAYMDETICFKEQSQVFSSCRDSVAMKVSKLEMELAELNITDVKFTEDICNLRLDHIECEKTAVQQVNDTMKCPDVVIGLRLQQECMLLPYECRDKNPSRLVTVCRTEQFYLPERESYKRNSVSVMAQMSFCIYVVQSVLVAMYLSLQIYN
ncbi:hypothetical protein RRG08_012740 [Elysia crispata]|uniref:Uncharacterized protein n=1 Tax=Elysia crispata TaxID=231223 RepID=A0AAE1DUS7_9GAST|nr:hypothetical protein RRG08_012740 [Elysia crispata]